jgi:sugar/nucleoside kinase (ribokinase family)
MKRVLGLGNALVDLLIQMKDDNLIKDLELPKGSMILIDDVQAKKISSLIEKMDVQKVSGGSAANSIHGIARLGVPCGYIGKVNEGDELGNFFENDLHNAGIKTSLLRGKAPSGCAHTFISPDGERTFATYLGAAVEMNAQELTEEAFSGYDIFHIEGYLVYNRELIEQALILAKKNNMLVSLDMASYNVVEDNLDFLKRILPKYVDIVFANEEEAKSYTGKEPTEALDVFAEDCDIAVVKVGKDGSMIKNKGKVYNIPVKEIKPTDTTGAGDSYAAGFLYGMNLDLPFDKCGQLGALLASKVIENYGARIADKDWEELITKAGEIVG